MMFTLTLLTLLACAHKTAAPTAAGTALDEAPPEAPALPFEKFRGDGFSGSLDDFSHYDVDMYLADGHCVVILDDVISHEGGDGPCHLQGRDGPWWVAVFDAQWSSEEKDREKEQETPAAAAPKRPVRLTLTFAWYRDLPEAIQDDIFNSYLSPHGLVEILADGSLLTTPADPDGQDAQEIRAFLADSMIVSIEDDRRSLISQVAFDPY